MRSKVMATMNPNISTGLLPTPITVLRNVPIASAEHIKVN